LGRDTGKNYRGAQKEKKKSKKKGGGKGLRSLGEHRYKVTSIRYGGKKKEKKKATDRMVGKKELETLSDRGSKDGKGKN